MSTRVLIDLIVGPEGTVVVVAAVRKFHLYAPPRVISVNELAAALGMPRPVSLRELERRLDAIPPEIRLGAVITTGTALGGRADLVLRSDGTYTSSGHMRAGGLPSFLFHVTVAVDSARGRFRPMALHQGRVFGADTPGDDRKNWNEDGHNENIRQHWLSIAEGASLSVTKEYELTGTIGVVADVAVAAVQFVGIALVSNPGVAAALTLASALGSAADEPMPLAKLPVGVTIAGGILLVFGPGAVIPAIVAGGAAELAVQHRSPTEAEYVFAQKVFGHGTLPAADRIVLTNMLGLGDRRYVMPGVGGAYLVNLGQAAFDDPMGYTTANYPRPGQLFIHELTHVWQAERRPAVAYFCSGATEGTYSPGSDAGRAWGEFGLEQQATIVDNWYADLYHPDNAAFLTGQFQASRVPDYQSKRPHPFDRYVYSHVRAGID